VLDGFGAMVDVGDAGKSVVPSAVVLVAGGDVCGGGSVSDKVGSELVGEGGSAPAGVDLSLRLSLTGGRCTGPR